MTKPKILLDKKKHLSKHKREPSGIKFVLTDRDIEILKAVNRCRYLKTSQIKKLVFADNKTIQPTRRRLKYLYHNKFLDRVVPFVQIGKGEAETAYFLDKEGTELLKDSEEEIYVYSKTGQVKHHFLSHALGISEFRINLEIALKNHTVIDLKRFTADFEIKAHTKEAVGKKIYKLFDEVTHPINKGRYIVYPDALIVFQGKGKYSEYQKLFFLEIDRGTEGLSRIQNKIVGYHIYFQQKIFTKFGKFKDFTILLQTNSTKRAQNIRKSLTDLNGTQFLWITTHNKANEKTILHNPIWQDHELNMRSLLK